MKIFHITTHFHPFIGGLENFTKDLATEQQKNNHQVEIITLSSEKKISPLNLRGEKGVISKDLEGGIKIHRLPGQEVIPGQYTIPKFGYTKKITEILNPLQEKTIIFTHTRFFLTSLFAGRAIKKLQKKSPQKFHWIHIEHGQNHVRSKNPLIKVSAWIFDQMFAKYIFKNADHIVVLTKTSKKFWENFCKNIPQISQKITIIENGVKIPDIKPPLSKEDLGGFTLKEENFQITYFGRMIREKGIYEILDAIKILNKQIKYSSLPSGGIEGGPKKITLNFYGKFPNKKQQEKFLQQTYQKSPLEASALGGDLEGVIKYHGQISPEEIPQVLQSSDLILLPSHSEGHSLAVLEAAAYANPIIATPVGQNQKILSKDSIIPIKSPQKLAQKIQDFLKTPDLLKKEGQKNHRTIIENYSFQKTVENYEKIIQKITQ